jgi:hypothetical protein
VITPAPPVKAANRLELLPEVIVDGVALKMLIVGNTAKGFTVTVTLAGTLVPLDPAQVSV